MRFLNGIYGAGEVVSALFRMFIKIKKDVLIKPLSHNKVRPVE